MRLYSSELPSLPPRANDSGYFVKAAGLQSVSPVPTAKNETMEQLVPHPGPHKASESLPSLSQTEVSHEIAAKAINAIAEICGVTVDELRSICGSGPGFIDSLGFDSLLSLEVEFAIEELGVVLPRSATGQYLAQKDLEIFLESFIVEYIDAVDRVGS